MRQLDRAFVLVGLSVKLDPSTLEMSPPKRVQPYETVKRVGTHNVACDGGPVKRVPYCNDMVEADPCP